MVRRTKNDNLKHVRKVYNNYLAYGVVPKKRSEEYALFLYGDWLFKNNKL